MKYLKFFFWVDALSAIPFDYFISSGFWRYIGLIKVFRLFRMKHVINNLGFGAGTRAQIRIVQLIIILLMAIHLSTCYLYAVVSSNYQDEDTSFFWFNYWMPPVDLNDLSTPYYEDS
jgi:hyperpolarization activated cyclic nucleotide-gated potassium channel 2